MAISKGRRFPVEFDDAFLRGLAQVGEGVSDIECLSRQEWVMDRLAQ